MVSLLPQHLVTLLIISAIGGHAAETSQHLGLRLTAFPNQIGAFIQQSCCVKLSSGDPSLISSQASEARLQGIVSRRQAHDVIAPEQIIAPSSHDVDQVLPKVNQWIGEIALSLQASQIAMEFLLHPLTVARRWRVPRRVQLRQVSLQDVLKVDEPLSSLTNGRHAAAKVSQHRLDQLQ